MTEAGTTLMAARQFRTRRDLLKACLIAPVAAMGLSIPGLAIRGATPASHRSPLACPKARSMTGGSDWLAPVCRELLVVR